MSESDEFPLLDNAPVYEVDCDNCGRTMMTNNKHDINLCELCKDIENVLSDDME
jgi:hypothetical protein